MNNELHGTRLGIFIRENKGVDKGGGKVEVRVEETR
jgi:hypothetical protein